MWGTRQVFLMGSATRPHICNAKMRLRASPWQYFFRMTQKRFFNKTCPPVYAKPLPFTLRINSNLLFLQVRIAHLQHIVQIL